MSTNQNLGALSAHQSLVADSERVSTDEAEALARQYYSLRCRAQSIDGERDGNFVLTTDDGERFMLKVVHSGEALSVTEAQTAVLLHIARVAPHLPVPRVRPTVRGAATAVVDAGPAAGRTLRLVTFLAGAPMRSVEPTAALRGDIGRTLAEVGLALQSFTHPATAEPMLWDIAQLPKLRPMVTEIAEPRKRDQLLGIIDDFECRTWPRVKGLRKQAVHNDFSADNLLVGTDGASVTGVVDFGDMAFTQLVNDVAVAAAYNLTDDPDPTGGAVEVINGYQQIVGLQDAERAVLFDLIAARMATRLAITEWRGTRFPENRHYILRNTPRTWRQLNNLLQASNDEFTRRITP
ncbi:phosphotransferase [Mycolicibacterium sp. HK-90]|uniref:phosphotransferase n=1 Tax=Mycolicibacterium sp. HK-90 TaxID=3056937 RepID=UPI0026597A54|nr:phosphotransferase [Mycolicibacterium sp. HK-90]WKG03962.1 phosphotransferase [Mycolicibacterium sp. HK-90]